MLQAMAVTLGSGLGGLARWGLAVAGARLWGEAFPWATLLSNLIGSAAIGWFAVTLPEASGPGAGTARLFMMIGLCGGFTTFSSFSLQTVLLARAGQIGAAALNVALSVGLCLAGTLGGATLAASR